MALICGGVFAEVKRGGRGLCGLWLGRGLQPFQRVGVKEEVDQPNVSDAVVITIGGRILTVYNHLLEVVAGMFEREGLLRHLLLVGNHPCRLDVNALVAAIHHKVDFVGAANRLALCLREAVHAADIHIVSAPDEFIENHILHQVRMFALTLRDMDVSDACVGGVVFGRGVEVASVAMVVFNYRDFHMN